MLLVRQLLQHESATELCKRACSKDVCGKLKALLRLFRTHVLKQTNRNRGTLHGSAAAPADTSRLRPVDSSLKAAVKAKGTGASQPATVHTGASVEALPVMAGTPRHSVQPAAVPLAAHRNPQPPHLPAQPMPAAQGAAPAAAAPLPPPAAISRPQPRQPPPLPWDAPSLKVDGAWREDVNVLDDLKHLFKWNDPEELCQEHPGYVSEAAICLQHVIRADSRTGAVARKLGEQGADLYNSCLPGNCLDVGVVGEGMRLLKVCHLTWPQVHAGRVWRSSCVTSLTWLAECRIATRG